MRVLSIGLVMGLAACLPAGDDDDGLVTFARGYPKAGPKTGQVLIQGSVKPQSGYTVVAVTAQIWPAEGGVVTAFPIPLNDDGTFGPFTASGLDSGAGYNVIVRVAEKRGDEQQERATGPVVIVVR